jgi:cation diffusion facilitator CzcD-associated flavoprotein CzcO
VREALRPDSRYGCKRGLISDDFYPSFNRDNVELVASGLKEVTPGGAITDDGREIEADVIIYCTGYRILDFDRFEVLGSQGQTLEQFMADDPRAYKGLCVPGFPNFFFAVGPNALVLNVPYFKTAEKTVDTIVKLLADMRASGTKAIVVKPELFQRYNDKLAGRFPDYSWGAADCNSYYRNASGHAPFLFPGNFKEFCKLQEESGLHEYEQS